MTDRWIEVYVYFSVGCILFSYWSWMVFVLKAGSNFSRGVSINVKKMYFLNWMGDILERILEFFHRKRFIIVLIHFTSYLRTCFNIVFNFKQEERYVYTFLSISALYQIRLNNYHEICISCFSSEWIFDTHSFIIV